MFKIDLSKTVRRLSYRELRMKREEQDKRFTLLVEYAIKLAAFLIIFGLVASLLYK